MSINRRGDGSHTLLYTLYFKLHLKLQLWCMQHRHVVFQKLGIVPNMQHVLSPRRS